MILAFGDSRFHWFSLSMIEGDTWSEVIMKGSTSGLFCGESRMHRRRGNSESSLALTLLLLRLASEWTFSRGSHRKCNQQNRLFDSETEGQLSTAIFLDHFWRIGQFSENLELLSAVPPVKHNWRCTIVHSFRTSQCFYWWSPVFGV